ncbi:SusC/RagA family TonB-linked outer membrane protein [Xanthocytophaga flava]|uniref:SusC/RagA family TonB-linked outer membrane protein n=1 Tax=Xanthocytophaga flava TaxID=3048013 RepID=UPI0028D3FE6B|nr:TonB-dependent receptor [Xanthocytophaga flavus]MDJ1470284.1 TonB-dependent receptor [Xanthocytophaga flavus]
MDHVLVTVSFRNASVKEVFKAIGSQTDFTFTYQKDLVENYTRKLTFDADKKSVRWVLQQITAQTGLVFRQFDQIIAVSDNGRANENTTKKTTLNTPYPITGTVKDAQSGMPLQGAVILIKQTRIGSVTDVNGNFSLELPDQEIISEQRRLLVVSYIGYLTREIIIDNQTHFEISLSADNHSLNEVLVIGYGRQSKALLTSSIAKLDSKEIKDQPVSSFDQAMAGRLPGVNISQNNGAPAGGINITIRGVSSISGGTNPLIVVDGVPLSSSSSDLFSQGQSTNNDFSAGYTVNPLSAMNPSDIESVEVLKDAAATAIYGSRGSNGVILITTKSGQLDQKSRISFNAYGGLQQVTKKVDVMDAYQFARYSKLARDLSWISKNPAKNSADDPLDKRATSGDKYALYLIPYLNGEAGLTNTDWQDEIFRSAPIQNYELSASGGTKSLSYYVSGNYFNQQGIIINSGVKRYGARINLKANLTPKLRIGVNFNPSFSDHKVVQTEQNWWREGVVITALMYHPNLPVRNADGSFALGEMIRTSRSGESSVATIENPVALAELIDNSLNHTKLLGNTYLEFDILKNLTFRTSFGTDLNYMDRFFYRPKTLNWRTEYAPTTTFNYAWTNNSSVYNWLSENTLNYTKSIGSHNLTAFIGYTAQKETNKRLYLEGRNFPNDKVTTLNAATSTNGFSEERQWALLSYLGRVQYDFNGKYLLSASIRRDGSSRFGENTKWGWFPSVSAGWRISDENFFSSESLVSNLKLRTSYGLTGNTEIPFYGGTALLNIENYVLGNVVRNGLAPITSPNANLSWEATKTVNIGADLGLFKNRISLSVDYYHSNTNHLLLDVTVPGSSGFQSSLQNIGKLENKGLEVLLTTSLHLGKLTWNGSANFATNRNKVLALAPGQNQFLVNGGLNDPAFIVRVGESIGSYYGYKVLGVFKTEEQFKNTPHLMGQNQGVGDFIYADVDGDGDVDANDRTVLGNNNPKFTWGFTNSFTYKGVDVSFTIQGKHGVKIFNAMHRYLAETWGNNLSVYLSDQAPRPVWGVGSASHTRPSSWHVEDGSFVRVRNLTLGYTIPTRILTKDESTSVRVYISSLNPFTFTKYSGYNPEVSNNFGDAVRAGEEFGNYPVAKSFVIGLNVNF